MLIREYGVKETLLRISGGDLMVWLFSKENYRCPDVITHFFLKGTNPCSHCGQPIGWDDEKNNKKG